MSQARPNNAKLVPPRDPLIRISATHSAIIPQLKDAWDHRELIYFLIWRDLKVRYRQTLLGVAWVILQPVLMTLVLTIFFSKLGHFQSEGVPYPLFAYAGLVPWTFVANSVSVGSVSLLTNSSIITKVYFPRLLIPTAIVGVRLVDLSIASAVLIVMMLFYGVGIRRNILMLPLFVAESTVLAIAIGSWLSVLNIRYRDIGTLLPVVIQLWMFSSPIIYPVTMVPQRWRWLYSLNPLVGIVEGFRAAFFGLPFDWHAIAVSVVVTLALLAYVLYAFNRWQEYLIDRL
jgi:lipopolysaccharide transport system permease protein